MNLGVEVLFLKEKRKKFRENKENTVSYKRHDVYSKHGQIHSNLLREMTAKEQLKEYMKED